MSDTPLSITPASSMVNEGKPVTGKTELADIIGEKAADRFCEWLGLKKNATELVAIFGCRTASGLCRAVPESDVANAERFATRNGTTPGTVIPSRNVRLGWLSMVPSFEW